MDSGSGPHPRPYGVGKKFVPAIGAQAAGAPTGAAAAAAASVRRDLDAMSLSEPSGFLRSALDVHVIDGPSGRIACVADIRGNIRQLNQVAAETKAAAIIHTGDFGFYTRDSLTRMNDRTLRHVVQYSPLLSAKLRSVLLDSSEPRDRPALNSTAPSTLRTAFAEHPDTELSEFPQLLAGAIQLHVPVFTAWGSCEDVQVLERLRTGEYSVPNLHILDEATTHAVEVGGVRLRLFGLGGAVVLHKLFDNGAGAGTIAGGQGAMWTTMLQIGELVELAQQVYDPSETRVLVTHASPGREGLIAQLAHALRADFSISAGLHMRYVTAYNDFGVHTNVDAFRAQLQHAKTQFQDVWDAVRPQVEAAIDPSQRALLNHALGVALRVPQPLTAGAGAGRDDAWKNTWYWNLPDAALGSLVLDISHGRVSTEARSQGLSFAYRRQRSGVTLPKTNVVLPAPRDGKAPSASLSGRAGTALFVGHLALPQPATEQDVRAYFGEHAAQISHVHVFHLSLIHI